jgi:hypothetical protein
MSSPLHASMSELENGINFNVFSFSNCRLPYNVNSCTSLPRARLMWHYMHQRLILATFDFCAREKVTLTSLLINIVVAWVQDEIIIEKKKEEGTNTFFSFLIWGQARVVLYLACNFKCTSLSSRAAESTGKKLDFEFCILMCCTCQPPPAFRQRG